MQEGFGSVLREMLLRASTDRAWHGAEPASISTETQSLRVQGTFQIRLFQAVTGTLPLDQAAQALNTPRDGDPTTSLGNIWPYVTGS